MEYAPRRNPLNLLGGSESQHRSSPFVSALFRSVIQGQARLPPQCLYLRYVLLILQLHLTRL